MSPRQIASKLSPKGWLMVGAAAAAAVLFLVVVMSFASKPSYSTLMTGLDPAQTGKITTALDAKGITYQLQNGGTALAVQSSQTSEARIALASGGLLGNHQPGFELLNSQQLGASTFQQQITYQRALEGQLDQTIQQIQGIDSAQVNLVLPNPQAQLFADNSQSASASVLLSGATALDSSTVRGIAQLVASSVPGLQSNKVTIMNGAGQPLWPISSDGAGGASMSKQAAQAQYDATMAAQVNAMLTQTLGPGKAQVAVNADVDANQATSDTLAYGKQGVALQQQAQNETLTGGGVAGGLAGAAGNIPAAAAAAAGTTGAGSNYRNTTSTTTFGVNKTVTHNVVAPGTVNRQSVSVLVDSSVPAAAMPALRAAVASAVGLSAKRGDVISIAQIAFAKPVATVAKVPNKMLGYAKYVLVGLGVLIFLFLMRRTIRKREKETFVGQPTWLRELETPRSLAALEAADDDPTEVRRLKAPVNVPMRQVEELVERDPDRVAQQVRAWMSED